MGHHYSQLSATERNDLHSRILNGESLRSIARENSAWAAACRSDRSCVVFGSSGYAAMLRCRRSFHFAVDRITNFLGHRNNSK